MPAARPEYIPVTTHGCSPLGWSLSPRWDYLEIMPGSVTPLDQSP